MKVTKETGNTIIEESFLPDEPDKITQADIDHVPLLPEELRGRVGHTLNNRLQVLWGNLELLDSILEDADVLTCSMTSAMDACQKETRKLINIVKQMTGEAR
jgi:hypothetical protein